MWPINGQSARPSYTKVAQRSTNVVAVHVQSSGKPELLPKLYKGNRLGWRGVGRRVSAQPRADARDWLKESDQDFGRH